jgi:mRNA-degrading endonuclease RelE of RelBE toxin-antitoxin system
MEYIIEFSSQFEKSMKKLKKKDKTLFHQIQKSLSMLLIIQNTANLLATS